MLMVSALAMAVTFCLQAVLNVVIGNDLVDPSDLGLSFETLRLLQNSLTAFGRIMGGVFFLSVARPFGGRSEGARSLLYGCGAVFLVAAGIGGLTLLSSLLPADPMMEFWRSGSGDAWMLRLSFSAVYLLCDVMMAIFAIYAGIRFRGAMLAFGILVAILCGLQAMHDMADIWFGTLYEFGVDLPGDIGGVLSNIWFDEAELRWRVMSIVDAVAKMLFALVACLTASRLSRRPPPDQGLQAQ